MEAVREKKPKRAKHAKKHDASKPSTHHHQQDVVATAAAEKEEEEVPQCGSTTATTTATNGVSEMLQPEDEEITAIQQPGPIIKEVVNDEKKVAEEEVEEKEEPTPPVPPRHGLASTSLPQLAPTSPTASKTAATTSSHQKHQQVDEKTEERRTESEPPAIQTPLPQEAPPRTMPAAAIPIPSTTLYPSVVQQPAAVVVPQISVTHATAAELDGRVKMPPELYPRLAAAPAVATQTRSAAAPPMMMMEGRWENGGEWEGMEEEESAAFMNEAQLLEHYQNEQLEWAEDFVDVFVEHELVPTEEEHNPAQLLNTLLHHYQKVCERLEENETVKPQTLQRLTDLNQQVWDVSTRRAEDKRGKCGCGHPASSAPTLITYKVAHMREEKLNALKAEMQRLTEQELDVGMSGEARARALALQIQWLVVEVNRAFLVQHQLTALAQPMLIPHTHSLPSRLRHRATLTTLFFYVRQPMLPQRFRDSLSTWVLEAGSVLLKAATFDDQLFLLSHLLRSPSPLQWVAPLLQTYLNVPCVDLGQALNSFLALLAQLLQPVRQRENFMRKVVAFYSEGENEWNVISEDDDNLSLDTSPARMAELTEADWIVLLGQFSIPHLYSAAIRHFTHTHKGNRMQVMLSLVSFTLILLKLLHDGLNTHQKMKAVCKRICDYLRRSVSLLAAYWDLCKGEFARQRSDQRLLQRELDRTTLQAIHYVVVDRSGGRPSAPTAGLYQFLVDLPYASLSEQCRLRCCLLMRGGGGVAALLKLHGEGALEAELAHRPPLGEQLTQLSGKERRQEDATYLVAALAAIAGASQRASFVQATLNELLHVCFLDEATRSEFYKAGSEAVATLLGAQPQLLTMILRLIDRNVDHLDEYAVDILSNAHLSNCRLDMEDVGGRLGKWLINRPITHPASLIARRVLSSMNWGPASPASPPSSPIPNGFGMEEKSTGEELASRSGRLWLDQSVHDELADLVVKAHIVNCKQRNGMISKSVQKATKLAMKIPDVEQQFDQFCWDLLLRLKVSERPLAAQPTQDITAFYLHLKQKCLATPELFLDAGLKYFQELVNSSAFPAAVSCLIQLVSSFPTRLHTITANSTFRECFDRLLHADESHYAVQLLVGADRFPGPVLQLLTSGVAHQLGRAELGSASNGGGGKRTLAMAWISLLTCPKPITGVEWNEDKHCLHLLGQLAALAVAQDPEHLLGMEGRLEAIYRAQLAAWAQTAGKGLFAMFTTPVAPPLLPMGLMEVSEWATYLLLRVEPRLFAGFYELLEQGMAKHPQRALEEVVKKAASKLPSTSSSTSQQQYVIHSVERLHYHRWLLFIQSLCKKQQEQQLPAQQQPRSSQPNTSYPHQHSLWVLPLALEQLLLQLFHRFNDSKGSAMTGAVASSPKSARPAGGSAHCVGPHYLKARESQPLFQKLRDEWLPLVDVYGSAEVMPAHHAGIFKAVGQWVWMEQLYGPRGSTASGGTHHDMEQPMMEHWLHSVMNRRPSELGTIAWLEPFVNITSLKEALRGDARLYSISCHLECMATTAFHHQMVDTNGRGPQKFTSMTQFFLHLDAPTAVASPSLQQLPFPAVPAHPHLPTPEADPSRAYWYFEEVGREAQYFVTGRDRVDAKCALYAAEFQHLYQPRTEQHEVKLRCTNYGGPDKCPKPLAATLSVTTSDYNQGVAERMNANRSKRVEEVSGLLARLDATAMEMAQLEWICAMGLPLGQPQAGQRLFYHLVRSPHSNLLYPACVECLEACLHHLGARFIRNHASEQLPLMRMALSGELALAHCLLPHFTPHCLPDPGELLSLYSELSNAVRGSGHADVALALLRQLDINSAGARLPPQQFSLLLPVIFETMAAAVAHQSDSPLSQLCQAHFLHATFHQFPHNFAPALRLMLSGADSGSLPAQLVNNVLEKLGAAGAEMSSSSQWSPTLSAAGKSSGRGEKGAQRELLITRMDHRQLDGCLEVIARQLQQSRHELSIRLFTVWAPCLEAVTRLAMAIVRQWVKETFNAERTTAQIEMELSETFNRRILPILSPLIDPLPNGLPPWTADPTSEALAGFVLNHVVQLLQWLPHSLYLPPGSDVIEALFWRHTASAFVGMQKQNSAHVLLTFQTRVVRMQWARFWPNLLDLGLAEKWLVEGALAEVGPIVVEVLVRLPWAQLIALHRAQPMVAQRAFHSLLLSIFTRCVAKSGNYSSNRASTEKLLLSLAEQCDWPQCQPDVVERCGRFIAGQYPASSCLQVSSTSSGSSTAAHQQADDVLRAFLALWREACLCSTLHQTHPQGENLEKFLEEANAKRAVYFRTKLRLLLGCSQLEVAERIRLYAECIAQANSLVLAGSGGNSSLTKCYGPLARELVAFYPEIHGSGEREKLSEAMLKQLVDWLGNSGVESPLVLLLMNTAVECLQPSATEMGLELVDECIRIYFKRASASTDWSEITTWLAIPERCRDWLFATPSQSSPYKQPHFLAMNAHLTQRLSASESAAGSRERNASEERRRLLRCLADYLQALKPKYVPVEREPGFLLCIEKWLGMVVQLYYDQRQGSNNYISQANAELDTLSNWLRRVGSGEIGGSDSGATKLSLTSMLARFSGRKQGYSTRVQLLASLLHLFLVQQQIPNSSSNQTASSSTPRLSGDRAVLNSRVHAVKELVQQSRFQQEIGAATMGQLHTEVAAFFTRVELYYLSGESVELLFHRTANLLWEGEKSLRKRGGSGGGG